MCKGARSPSSRTGLPALFGNPAGLGSSVPQWTPSHQDQPLSPLCAAADGQQALQSPLRWEATSGFWAPPPTRWGAGAPGTSVLPTSRPSS